MDSPSSPVIPRRVAQPLARALDQQNLRFHRDLADATDAVVLLETVAGGTTGRARHLRNKHDARTPQEQATWARLENDTLSLAVSLRGVPRAVARSELIHAFPPQFSAASQKSLWLSIAIARPEAPTSQYSTVVLLGGGAAVDASGQRFKSFIDATNSLPVKFAIGIAKPKLPAFGM